MTAEDWQGWVGRKGALLVDGPYPVSEAAIGYLAEALEDERLAQHVAHSDVVRAPRSFVNIASRVPNWRPSGAYGPETFLQAMLVPLPATSAVNLSVDQHYFQTLVPGDRVSSRSTIRSVTPKSTRLGEGFIIVEEIEHVARGGLIAKTVNTMLRFSPSTQSRPPAKRESQTQSVGSSLARNFPPIRVPITMTRLVAGAAAVRDFSPLHHDVEFAQRVGHPTAFLSYSYQIALVVSAIGRWFDGDTRLRRLKLDMKIPVYLGRTATCTASVAVTSSPKKCDREAVAIDITTEDGICTLGLAELETKIDHR